MNLPMNLQKSDMITAVIFDMDDVLGFQENM